jgi:hypothetical protein
LRLLPARRLITLDYDMRKLRELLELILTMIDLYGLIEWAINFIRNFFK